MGGWGVGGWGGGQWHLESGRKPLLLHHPMLHCSLTHWGRVTHICVGNLTIIGPDNGLSPGRRQAIFWTNAGILLIGPWGTNFSKILIGIRAFSFKKIHLKMSSAKWCPFWLDLNVLSQIQWSTFILRSAIRTASNICQLTEFTNLRMHLFHIPQCSIQNRNVHISVLNRALWEMELVHSGICEIVHLMAMFHTPLTILQPRSWDCVTVLTKKGCAFEYFADRHFFSIHVLPT